MFNRIQRIFEAVSTHSLPRFVLEVSLLAFFLKVPSIFLTDIFLSIAGLGYLVDQSAELQLPVISATDFILAVGFAPFVETLLGQWLPTTLALKFTKNSKVLMAVSAAVFMILHYPSVAFFPGAFVIGLILSWCWLLKRKNSWRSAFFTTSLVHALHNFYAYALVFLLGPV